MPVKGDAPALPGARATARFVRISPNKARRVVNLVRGLPAKEALTVLQFAPQAASEQVYKVLASAPVARPTKKAAPAKATKAAPATAAEPDESIEADATEAPAKKAAKKAPAKKAAKATEAKADAKADETAEEGTE